MSDCARLALSILAAAAVCGSPAGASERLPGPIPARVERVIDGDTLVARARIWLGLEMSVSVRLEGIDTPELRGPECEAERIAAVAARAALVTLAGEEVTLSDVRYGTYAGRVVARVIGPDGDDLSEVMLGSGLAVVYGEPGAWCAADLAAAVTTDEPAPAEPPGR